MDKIINWWNTCNLEFQDKLKKSHPGWNDVLYKASKMPGATVKPI